MFKRRMHLRTAGSSFFHCFSSRDMDLSSGVIPSDASIRYRTSSDCPIADLALSIPIFSTLSCVSWIPAVSVSLSWIPLTRTLSWRVSRVVPAISVTIALSVPAR